MLLLLLNKSKKKFVHSRNKKSYHQGLSSTEAKTRRQRCIPRVALHFPKDSAWRKLYESKDDQALITFTGLDHDTFSFIENKFRPYFDGYSPHSNDSYLKQKVNHEMGRKRLIDAKDCLGLVLAWTRTRGSQMVLQIIFGMTQSSVSVYLHFAINLLVIVLEDIEEAKVKIPDENMIAEYQLMVKNRHLRLNDVWCTMDGLKLYLECPGDDDEQNNFYNGWQCDHFVNAVLVFCPDGTIPICCYNVPGTQHDSKIAYIGGIYDKLKKVYDSTGWRNVHS